MLIVLEGLDGAGKSTQLKMVTSYFASLGRKVDYLHFPRYSAPLYGELIAKFLRGDFGAIDQVHPQLVALLFAEDRRDASGFPPPRRRAPRPGRRHSGSGRRVVPAGGDRRRSR